MARKSRLRQRKRKSRRQPRLRPWLVRALVLVAVCATAYVAYLDLFVRAQFDGKRWSVPARIYARALELYPGMRLSEGEFIRELRLMGYQPSRRLERPGSYARSGATVRVATRSFDFWDAREPARKLSVGFRGSRLVSLTQAGTDLAPVRLDPVLIGHVYPSHHEDRVLVRLRDVPPLLIKALMAVEDRTFHRHHGVSVRAIARASVANLKAGAAVQGGSTLTQQLAKNFFLSPERSLKRKLNEAAIALILELHYSKAEILEAYLNEVYLGQQGRRAIHGFGLGAEFYFGRPLQELRLPELALLVGLVRGPSLYDPRRHPARARSRRGLVLRVMAEQGFISAEEERRARSARLGVTGKPPADTPYPAFLDLVRRQLRRDYRDQNLRTEGLRIFTTLDPRVQRAAEQALTRRALRLERARGISSGRLQGAAVVTNAQDGEVLAVVGGRNPRAAGFNRALDAVRPVGSLIKPAVYLTALERAGEYHLATRLEDGPLRIRGPKGEIWAPRNYDGSHHGTVPLHAALAHSYNVATVRLGMRLGVPSVVRTLKRLGVQRDLPAYPSLLLGAVELSPLEVSQMYQTLASGGFRMPLRAIRAVTDADGRRLTRYGLSVAQVADPGPVFLLTAALKEAMRNGTGRSVYTGLSPDLELAGKTGTTDDLRDSWFAGYSDDLVAVVWLGLDSNEPAGLTGAGGALRVWGDLMGALHPRSIRDDDAPASVVWHWTDGAGGRRTDDDCPGARRLPYLIGYVPSYSPCEFVIGAGVGWSNGRSPAGSG